MVRHRIGKDFNQVRKSHQKGGLIMDEKELKGRMSKQDRTDWIKELENRFTYHPPTGRQPEKYELIRSKAHQIAFDLVDLCPESRERNIALTHLDAVVFYANAAIARRSADE